MWDGRVRFSSAEGWGSFINDNAHAYTLVVAWHLTPALTLTAVADFNNEQVYLVWDLENNVDGRWTYECHESWPWEACCNSPVLAQNEPLDLALKLDAARTEMFAVADRMKSFLQSFEGTKSEDGKLQAWVKSLNEAHGVVLS